MNISPDEIILFQIGSIAITANIFFTWMVMLFLVLVSALITRKISISSKISMWQNFLETLISYIQEQIRDITDQKSDPYLPFIGSLFIFVSVSNFLSFVPGYHPPTGSLYTTSALAICVFFAVPVYGIQKLGLSEYLRNYIKPSVIMLPFNIISEISRTLALSVRLFGNVMSGTMIIGILLSVAPFFLPAVMNILELLIGQIQAYIIAVLSTVYIASGTRSKKITQEES
ncbi:F0F1 ATP synthase subunit A [candidate division KSB1 bacterium]|nr:F0F1 ATP synthase subunit A [candidate division KSB1 bacterium]